MPSMAHITNDSWAFVHQYFNGLVIHPGVEWHNRKPQLLHVAKLRNHRGIHLMRATEWGVALDYLCWKSIHWLNLLICSLPLLKICGVSFSSIHLRFCSSLDTAEWSTPSALVHSLATVRRVHRSYFAEHKMSISASLFAASNLIPSSVSPSRYGFPPFGRITWVLSLCKSVSGTDRMFLQYTNPSDSTELLN
jgi:hypothetical protein